MILKVIQWNIGGGKIRKITDPVSGPYTNEGISHIEDILKKYNPDIVTFQETHTDYNTTQANLIAQDTGLPFVINDIYDDSHVEKGQKLGQAIISRFPITEHSFEFFINPNIKINRPNGDIWISHDKGISKCLIELDNEKPIEVSTLHLVPFSRFEIDPLDESFEELRENIAALTNSTNDTFLLQGDFNYDNRSLKQLLPELLSKDTSEIILDNPTTPKGRDYDHVIFRGMKHVRSEVITEALTDHFPIYSEFEV